MGEGNIFTLCVSPHLDWGRGQYPIPGLDGGGTLGIPLARTRWGTPRSGLDGGTLPPARTGRGTTPGQDWMGYPSPSQDWMGLSHLARTGWGIPPPPGLDGLHTPPSQLGLDGITPAPIRQSSIASTCYAAVGMPLAFTQEDFLVYLFIYFCDFDS